MRYLFILCLLTISCVNSQKKTDTYTNVGGPCQGCEAIYEYGTKSLNAIDTLPDFNSAEQKIKITGTIYENDGKTPAKDVVVYAYHTDEKGVYPKREGSKGWEKRHGYIRGWIKTDKTGRYTFYTFRPASYPNTTIEQHIHLTIKEPDKNEYYIDDITFKDDPNLSNRTKNKNRPRGGSGIVSLKKVKQLMTAKRDIILGLHINNYPLK